jgi:hypothetical protein
MTAHGVELDVKQGGTHVMRACISPQEAANLQLLTDPDCRQDIVQRSADRIRIRFACEGEDASQGEGTITFRGDTRFSGRFTVETVEDGKTDRIESTQEARWLADDCGDEAPGR